MTNVENPSKTGSVKNAIWEESFQNILDEMCGIWYLTVRPVLKCRRGISGTSCLVQSGPVQVWLGLLM